MLYNVVILNVIRLKYFLIVVLAVLFLANKPAFKNSPPGTIPLTDSLFIDKFPVKVRDYIEFLNSLRYFYNDQLSDSLKKLPKYGLTPADIDGLTQHFHGDSLLHQRMLTRTWVTYSNDERRYDVDFHLKSTKFLDYPIVNITFEQMRYYCKWRTDMVMLHYATSCKTEKQRQKFPMNFKYRMVKRKEWELTISKYFHEIQRPENQKNNAERPNNMIRPYYYSKKRSFYYDVDNAAETLDNAVVTFNFKWNSSVRIGNISYFKFEEPMDWISFRCICEILPEKNVK